MKNMLRSMIDRFAGFAEPSQSEVPTVPYTVPANIPVIGMLLAPKHAQERFYTVLEMEMDKLTPEAPASAPPRIRVKLLKNLDNKKVDTVWFNSPDQFWKYYDEK